MNRTILRGFPFLLLALATSAHADDAALGRTLDRMSAAKGQEYLALRSEVIALPGAQAQLEKLLAGASWSAETFPRLSMAVIAYAHLASPEVVRSVYKLEGIDPAHYGKRRRADPECGRELRRLGQPAVGPMLEVCFKTFDSYVFPGGPDRPEALAKERAALREGLVVALAASEHPAVFFALRQVATSPRELEGARKQALESLGTIGTADALADLVRIHEDPAASVGLRLAAIRGVAQVPSRDALTWLLQRVDGDSAEERRAAVVGLGLFGSAWAWESRGREWAGQAEQLRSEAATALVDRLPSLVGCSDEVVEALATIASPKSALVLRRSSQDAALSKEAQELAKAALARVELAVERGR